ncbi:MAG: hypothetical protein H6667_14395 [Ardenticatenaceae bacterium]|nr:hypothetical protein [Ardenticatenaceae bacterium]MCB9444245.1 hypothetical protein [Ardenticatenaceae bacterium]
MDDFNQLTHQVRQWHGRSRLRDALIWLPRGLLAGLLVGVVVATVARLRPFLDNNEVGYVAVGLGIVGLLVSSIVFLMQRSTLVQQARFADRQFGLKERVSTAVEIHEGRLTVSDTLAEQQLADTLAAIRPVDAKRDLPLRLNRRDWLVLGTAVALLIAAVLLPNPQTAELLKRRAVTQAIEDQIEALETLQEEIQQNPDLTDEQQEQLLDPVENALQQLEAGNLSQEEAVAVLSEAEADLKELSSNLSTEDLRQRLNEAGQPLSDNAASQTLGQSLQSGNLAQAGAAAAQLADDLPTLSQEELSQLAQDLAETAAALEGIDTELSQQLAEAAQALQNGDIAAAQQALREASGTLQQRAQESAAAEQAAAAAGQLNEGRQEVAQAGEGNQSGQGQQGQGQQGQSGQEGQGQGQGQSQGQGEGSGEGQGSGLGQGSQTEQGQGQGGPGPGGGHAENVFVPNLVDLSGEEGVDIELPAECIANPANCGGLLSETPTEFTNEGSVVPYNQVFGDYRNAAYEALSDDHIPLGMKGYVRDYFSSLEP